MLSLTSRLGRAAFSTSASSMAIKTVTVVGCGLMGSGIAQVAAVSGHKVFLTDSNEAALQQAHARIQKSLTRISEKQFKGDVAQASQWVTEQMKNIESTSNIEKAAAASDLVVEAIIENLEIKRQLFSKLDKIAPEHTIFASNTSSLPIREISSATTRQDRFGGLHFFNPVPIMKLVEVIKTDGTSDHTFSELVAFGKAVGKATVSCKDTPGFVVNRLLVPYMAEAIRMLERGDASTEDIDVAMQLGAGMPMGPLTLADYVGLDTTFYVLDGWAKKYPEQPLFAQIPLLAKLVAEKKLGVKSGEGFYKYDKDGKKIITK